MKKTLILLVLFLSCFVSHAASQEEDKTLLQRANATLGTALFYDLSFGAFSVDEVDREGNPVLDESGTQNKKHVPVPLLIVLLGFGAVYFSIFYRFINFRGFKHAIDIVRGKYDDEKDEGEISHFRALCSALSATVGLGNIAGVAVAIQLGGPGAVIWMMLAAFLGMSVKFSSCTLAQLYRKHNEDGSISGGPMYYLDLGLREKGKILGILGKVLAIMYAFMVMGGAIGGGNMFQANQTVEAFTNILGFSEESSLYIGLIMAALVALVIIGGIKRIGAATSKIVPLMCGIYVLASLFIIFSNISKLPEVVSLMFTMAFSQNAFFGGSIGVLIMGIRRASFSNEAGLGSSAIAHAAAKTDEPVREGLVAMLEPFIDTVVVCFMTASVVIITGTWSDPSLASQGSNIGVTLTSAAFGSVIPWFPYVLAICICLFAYSTMISWCYYGERGWIYLLDHFEKGLGLSSVIVFRLIFVFFIVVGAVNSLSDVIEFSDLMILSMAFPNILGSMFLAPKVYEKLRDYCGRLKAGQMS